MVEQPCEIAALCMNENFHCASGMIAWPAAVLVAAVESRDSRFAGSLGRVEIRGRNFQDCGDKARQR